ncbi:hypothetical protein Bbelb_121100 [Branchiostoma belcheri]|nr:hypothetical protein Bbelb_121100 [Branchiostoma belcheri]
MAAASSIADDFDDEFLTCALCLDLYEDPKLLPCFHTLCKKCVEGFANISGGKGFQCPLCRANVKLLCPVQSGGVDKLPSNFYVNKMLDFRRLKLSKLSRVQCQMCKSGAQPSAVCGDCTFLLCNNCVGVHRNTPALQGHAIITLGDLENPAMRSQYARQIYCPRHPGQRTTFYCEPCTTLVCRDCTVDEHRWGENHDPRELEKVAPKYRASVEGLMKKTKKVISKINQNMQSLDKELTATAENCDQVEKEVQQHYEELISKLQREKQEMITKIQKTNKDRKEELIREKKEIEKELGKTNEGLAFCQNILERDNKTELLSLRQQMEERLQLLASQQTGDRTLEGRTKVNFQPCSLSQVSGGSLSVFAGFTIDVQEPAVESLPCLVTVTTNNADLTGGKVAPQIEVTSPQGKTTLIQTTAHTSPPLAAGKGQTSRVRRVWGAEWRPQQSGKHTLGVCMGGIKDLCSLTIDVGSNNPVLKLGQKGSQQGQFNTPIDVAVRGERLYVADTHNQRVQVFDLTDSRGNIVLANIGGKTDGVEHGMKLQVFRPDGTWVSTISSDGDKLNLPHGVAVTEDGHVFIVDYDDYFIRKYRYM